MTAETVFERGARGPGAGAWEVSVGRQLEALMRRSPAAGAAVEAVLIPLAAAQLDPPETLHDPTVGLPGRWRRESAVDERPARYVRID